VNLPYGSAGAKLFFTVAAVAVALCMGGCFRKQDLTSPEADAVISRSEEFSKSRTLVRVDWIDRGAPSMTNWALVGFSFRERSDGVQGAIVQAKAQLNWVGGRWHLGFFSYDYDGQHSVVEVK
jgi:hypothetical protein